MKKLFSIVCIALFFLALTIPLSAGSEVQKQSPLELVAPSTPAPSVAVSTADTSVKSANPVEIIEGIKQAKDWGDLVGWDTAILSFLITLGGYFSYLIPGFKNISNNTYRVLTFAILIIAGASLLGVGSIWQGALSYLFSTSLYEVILKYIVKTPKPDQTA